MISYPKIEPVAPAIWLPEAGAVYSLGLSEPQLEALRAARKSPRENIARVLEQIIADGFKAAGIPVE